MAINPEHKRVLSVVIPAFNEEKGIVDVLQNLQANLPDAEIIVVDDCSRDRTVEEAKKIAGRHENIVILQHLFNRGYGASLKTGMSKAQGEFIAWFDADGEHRVSDLMLMYEKIKDSSLVAVIGSRTSKSTVFVRGFGKWLIRVLAWSLQINAGNDLNCGLRIFRKEIITSYLSILPKRYSASLTTTILMLERGYPVVFYPVETEVRKGESKVKIADGFAALIKVLQLVTLFAPMRLFFRPGFIAFIFGILYGLYEAIPTRSGLPTAAVFLSLAGILLCILGLIADQISQIRLEQREPKGLVIEAPANEES